MCFRLLIFGALLGGALALGPVAAEESPTLELSASRAEIYLGESFVLQVKAAQTDGEEPDLSALTNALIRKLGSQDISNYSIVIVNGRMRREGFSGRIHAYDIQPLSAGPFTAGPVRLGARSEPGPVIAVQGIETQEVVALAIVATPATVLADEPFQVSLRLRVKALPGRYAEADPFPPDEPPLLQIPYLAEPADGLEPPALEPALNAILVSDSRRGALRINDYTVRNDPFNMNAFFNLQGGDPFAARPARFLFPRAAVLDRDQRYWEYTFDLPYRAAREGTYTFGPALFKGKVAVAPNGDRPLVLRPLFAVGPAATVRVIPPPEIGRPPSYIGVIGSNLTVSARLDAQTCHVGDPLTLTLEINGPGQWRNAQPLRLSLQTNLLDLFTIYQDQVQTVKADQSRQYRYTLRPIREGTFEIPPIAVSYYDAELRDYRTVASEPMPIRVNRAAEFTAAQVVAPATNRAERGEAAAPPVPRLAAVRLDPAGAKPASLLGPPALLYAAAVLPFLAFFAWLGRTAWRHRARGQQAWARHRALPRARRILHRARGSNSLSDPLFHQTVCAALRGYVAARWNLDAAPLTPSEIRGKLAGQGVDPDLVGRFHSLLDRHTQARLSGGAQTEVSRQAAVEEVDRLLAALDRESGRNRKARAGAGPLIALLLTLAAGAVFAQPEEGAFLWQEANSRMQAAQTPAEYARAAEIYGQMVERGIRNGPVFINRGIALFQAGRFEEAREAFRRAERYVGYDPEIVHSLTLAEARAAQVPDAEAALPWYRFPLAWHYALPGALRTQIAAAAWILFWFGWIARLFHQGPIPRRLIAAALILLALFGTSALTTLYLE